MSSTRLGVIGSVREPGVAALASATQPTTSATTSAVPALIEKLTPLSGPTRASTRLGTVWPATKLRLEAFGTVSPFGNTVR